MHTDYTHPRFYVNGKIICVDTPASECVGEYLTDISLALSGKYFCEATFIDFAAKPDETIAYASVA